MLPQQTKESAAGKMCSPMANRVKGRSLRRDPAEVLSSSLSELTKGTEFDISWVGILLKYLNSLSPHQNIRILDLTLLAGLMVPQLLRRKSSLFK